MVTSPTTSVAPNPFNMVPPTPSANTSARFEQQLSQALSESLAKLGVTPGAVNISITNSGGSSRQILISYDSASTATPSTTITAPGSSVAPQLPGVTQDAGYEFPWSPYDGPRDKRDQMPVGGGNVTASGAPQININTTAARNQYGYAGLAAFNPYFTSPSNPTRAGYVLGFNNWFRDAQILGGKSGPVQANSRYYATEEGAQEALRLVKMHEPDAELIQYQWSGGPFSMSNSMYYVSLPGNRMMNAGLVLSGYYNGGEGVTIASDDDLARAVRS